MLEKKVEFFQQEHTEYIPIVVIFLAFIVMFYYVKDYFIICCTSLIGAFMMIVGVGYSKYFDIDVLLDLEIGRWNNIDDMVDSSG